MSSEHGGLSLIVHVRGKNPRRVALANPLRVGAHPDNDLCLKEEGIAPRHFEIAGADSGRVLRVLDAGYELMLNGSKVSGEEMIGTGDVIETAGVRFLVDDPKSSAKAAGLKKARFLLFSAGEMYIIDVGERAGIGRGPGNHVTLADNLISRRHCIIYRKESSFRLKDLGSRNGTKLNGVSVSDVPLSPGDMIDVGRSTLFFTLEDALARDQQRDGADSADVLATTISGPYLSSSTDMDVKLSSVVGIDNLAALIKDRNNLIRLQEITKAVNSELKLDKLFRLIIDSAIELTEAEKGLLIRTAKKGGYQIRMARASGRADMDEAEQTYSDDIVRTALETGKTVRVGGPSSEPDGDPAKTAAFAGFSVLCVPLRIQEEVFGILYLDSPVGMGGFTEEDERLLETFGEQAAMAVERARFHEEMKEKHALEHEFAIAGKIQRKLFPHKIPVVEGLEVFGENLPAEDVGGDYYDFIESPDGKSLFICIGDVSGKGVSAGLIMVMVRSILRSLTVQYVSTKKILSNLNRILMPDLEGGRFISMILLRWDIPQRKLFYAGAGHEFLLIYRAKSSKVERKRTGGIIIGMPWPAQADGDDAEEEIRMDAGDQVLIYTDGVTEAPNPTKSFFGVKRLDKIIEVNGDLSPDALVYRILEKITDYMQKEKQRDDITLVAMKRIAD